MYLRCGQSLCVKDKANRQNMSIMHVVFSTPMDGTRRKPFGILSHPNHDDAFRLRAQGGVLKEILSSLQRPDRRSMPR